MGASHWNAGPDIRVVSTFAQPSQSMPVIGGSAGGQRLHGEVRGLHARRPHHHVWFDVAGGIAFAFVVGVVMMNVASMLSSWQSWSGGIGWETVWLVVALLCVPLMPSAVNHRITWNTTILGVALDWPEMVIACTILYTNLTTVGLPHGIAGPLGFSIAVGAAEEMIFRVLLLGWLATKIKPESAVLVSAAVFGLVHLQELSLVGAMNCTSQFAGGVVFGAIYLRTANPLGPIIGHAFWDFSIFVGWGLVSGGSTEYGMPTVAELWFPIVIAVYGMWLIRPSVPCVGRTPEMTIGTPIAIRA
jgi:membrane protease YdiL (CAAX protease family)